MCSEIKELKEFLQKRDYQLNVDQYLDLCKLFTNIRKIEYDKSKKSFRGFTDEKYIFDFVVKNRNE